MRFYRIAAAAALLGLSACASTGPVAVLQPVAPQVQQGAMIAEVDVAIAPGAQEAMLKFEEKAANKRAEAGLPPVDPAADLAQRPAAEEYATLPFTQMFELVMQDVTREWGLTSGMPVRLAVEIDTLKTANAGMAWLAASSDQLTGTVRVLDAQSSQQLGEFRVDVVNSHSGLLAMAVRGAGVREKLAEEFALEVSRQLTGRRSKQQS